MENSASSSNVYSNHHHKQQFLRSPSIPLRSLSTNKRIPSSLKRSSDLLSMEHELRELLKHSNLNAIQKKAFEEMLEVTFDLFQTPLHISSPSEHSNNENESLIDQSSVELYGKMQSLVAALTSLIIHEEECTKIDEFDETDIRSDFSHKNDSSTEFSDNEYSNKQNDIQVLSPRLSLSYNPQNPSPVLKHSQFNSPRNGSLSRISSIKRSSLSSTSEMRRSPTFRSSNLPTYQDISESKTDRIRQTDLNYRPTFQVMTTPVPRSFSQNHHQQSRNKSQRPKSMYVGSNSHTSNLQQRPSYTSPSDRSRRQSLLSGHDFYNNSQENIEYNGPLKSRSGSMVSNGERKRYSLRF